MNPIILQLAAAVAVAFVIRRLATGKWWVVALAVVVLGCGEDTGPRVVDPMLLSYVEAFEAEAGFPAGCSAILQDGVGPLPVAYGHTVLFDSELWPILYFSDPERECSVFHELGHCVLGRGHRNDRTEEGFILSIMEASGAACFGPYADNRDYYLDELFSR